MRVAGRLDFRVQQAQVDGQQVRLRLWDTAGQERFDRMTRSYFRGKHGVMLVFDIADAQSFAGARAALAAVPQLQALAHSCGGA